MTNPSIRFGNGRVQNNKPAVDPGLSIPNEPNSDWYVAQWGHNQFLSSTKMLPSDRHHSDTTLGIPLYTFNTIDDESRLSIYKSYDKKSFVYELFEQGGLLKGGGSDLFLSAEALVPNATLDYPIYYDVDVKLSQAFLHYNNQLAAADGAVLSQVGSGFVMSTSNLSDNMKVTLFLQLPISVSRIAGGSYRSCTFSGDGASIIANVTLPSEKLLSFEPNNGAPSKLHYILNDYLKAFLSEPILCHGDNGTVRDLGLLNGIHCLHNWSLNGMYIGIESEDSIWIARSPSVIPQGKIKTAVQISNLKVSKISTRNYQYGSCGSP